MSITFKGIKVTLSGHIPMKGRDLPKFHLVNDQLDTVTLDSFSEKVIVLASVPSLDTSVCSMETVELNKIAIRHPSVRFLVVSKDTPFAQKRFCKSENITNVTTLSDLRPDYSFGKEFGVQMTSGPLSGLLARCIFIVKNKKIIYEEIVSEVVTPPDFDKIKEILNHEGV